MHIVCCFYNKHWEKCLLVDYCLSAYHLSGFLLKEFWSVSFLIVCFHGTFLIIVLPAGDWIRWQPQVPLKLRSYWFAENFSKGCFQMNDRMCKKPFLCNDTIYILLNLSICHIHQMASWISEKLFLKYLRKTVIRIWKQCLNREFLNIDPSAEWSVRNNLDFILQSVQTVGVWLLGFNCFFWSARIMKWQLTIYIRKDTI